MPVGARPRSCYCVHGADAARTQCASRLSQPRMMLRTVLMVGGCPAEALRSGEETLALVEGNGMAVMRPGPRIDSSDVPASSPEQLRAMRRVGRPPLGERSRQLIAIRVDLDVLGKFRKEARHLSVGYQTLMNDALGEHVRRDLA